MAIVQDAHDDEHAPVLTVTEARGALRGRHAAWVLGVSMALIVAGFAALYLYHLPHLNSGPGGQTPIDHRTLEQSGGLRTLQRHPQSAPAITPGVGSDGRGL
jgi:hypothetical protein